MHAEVEKRLGHALEACERIELLTIGLSFETYEVCVDVYSATERQLDVLGIALKMARRKDPSLAERIPNMRQITRIRHQLLHRYDKVDNAAVWETVQTDVPALRAQISYFLAESSAARE